LRCRLLTTALAATALLSFPLRAQQYLSLDSTRSITSGNFLGLALDITNLSGAATNGRTYSGGGLNGELSYGFTPEFAAFIDGSVAGVRRNDTGFGYATHVDVDLRDHFADPARRLIPFAELAFTQRALLFLNVLENESQTDIEAGAGTLSGAAITIGAGTLYFFRPRWALRGAARFTTGTIEITRAEAGGETAVALNAQSVRLNLGVTWFRNIGP